MWGVRDLVVWRGRRLRLVVEANPQERPVMNAFFTVIPQERLVMDAFFTVS